MEQKYFCVFVSHMQPFLIAILQNFIQKKTSSLKSTIAASFVGCFVQLGKYNHMLCVCVCGVYIYGCACECVYVRTSKVLRLVHLSIL